MIFATAIIIGIDKLIAQPEYPIIKSIHKVSKDIAIECTNTLDAILIFLCTEYITAIQIYTIPAKTIKHHQNLVDVHRFTIKHVIATIAEIINITFIAIFPFFTFLTLGYKVMYSIPFHRYINFFFF